MANEKLNSAKAPAAVGPYSQGIKAGNIIFTSGQLPINYETGKAPETIEEQAVQSFENVKAVLAEAGVSLGDVVKTTVLLQDINDFVAVNKIYAEYFNEPYPARSCFQVAALPTGAKIEVEAIAVK